MSRQAGIARDPASEVGSLTSPGIYNHDRQHIFGTAAKLGDCFKPNPSLTWFIRKNKVRLVKAGGLVMHRGSWYINPLRFDAELLRIAEDEARHAVASGCEFAPQGA